MSTAPAEINKGGPLYFFSLEKDGKKSYLLGTSHALSLSVLSENCLNIIDSCTAFVTEESHENGEEDEFYLRAILRKPETADWTEGLNPWARTSLEKVISEYYAFLAPNYEKKIDALELWAAYQFAEEGFRSRMVQTANAFALETPETGMDHELLNRFSEENIKGVESALDQIPLYKKKENSMQDLEIRDLTLLIIRAETLLLWFAQNKIISLEKALEEILSNSEIKVTQQEMVDLIKDLKEDGEDSKTLLTSYLQGNRLEDPQYAKEQDQDLNTMFRNRNWIPNFLKHHQIPGQVLFGVGIAHFVGKQGLLSLLPPAGFEIKRLTPDGSFEAYTYASDAVSQTSPLSADTGSSTPPLLRAFEQMQDKASVPQPSLVSRERVARSAG